MTSKTVRASHHVSPLRYPGGKAKLAPYFKALLRKNHLLDGTYIEPFAGGGGVGLCLLLHGYVNHIVLNDLSAPVYAFWRAILDEPDRFQQKILDVDLTVEEWQRQRRVFQEAAGEVSFEVGFATFFLNRTNHSGVLNGGMIGGRNQNSTYGLDARFNKRELLSRVKRISNLKDNITAINLDANELLNSISKISRDRSIIIYIDPPYYRKGRDLYYDFYRPDDHKKLRDVIVELDAATHWVVSYDNEPAIRELYNGCQTLEYSLSYSVRNGRQGKEVMFLSDSLIPASLSDGGLRDLSSLEVDFSMAV